MLQGEKRKLPGLCVASCEPEEEFWGGISFGKCVVQACPVCRERIWSWDSL